jgi:tetratricopeptide (TPR) repeat protein
MPPTVSPSLTPSQLRPVSTLLVDLVLAALASSLTPTALFLAELLLAVNPESEASVFFLALCLHRDGQHRAAIELIRTAPAAIITASLRCQWVYAKSCANVKGREREGREVLQRALDASNGSVVSLPRLQFEY